MTKIAAPEGRRIKPKLGQHFLVDTAAPMRIVEALAPVRELIRKEIGTSAGEISRRISIDDAITDFPRPEQT